MVMRAGWRYATPSGPLLFIIFPSNYTHPPNNRNLLDFVINLAKSSKVSDSLLQGTGKERALKRRTNNHRSKHKDNRLHEGYKSRKDRSLREKKTNKYGVSTLLEDDSRSKPEEEE